MMLQDLLQDLIIYMWKFSFSDNDRYSLTKTCRYFRDLGLEIGYLKHISLSGVRNFIKFIKNYNRSKSFLEKIVINNIHNPVSWMSDLSWSKEMIFNNCCMDNEIINIPKACTEKLVVTDLHYKSNFYIDWSKLADLKILDLNVYDINFTGMEKCQLLEVIRLNLDENKFFPDFLANLPNLKIIATNCFSRNTLHFVSKQLKICLVPKKEKFTSDSDQVPKSHLDMNFIMNIRCLDI